MFGRFFTISLSMLASISVLSQGILIGKARFCELCDEDKPEKCAGTYVNVYEDNKKGKGKKIPLYMEVLPAQVKTGSNVPLFIIVGGPGQACTDLVSFFSEIFHEYNKTNDIVFIDQRGTGKSNPLKLQLDDNSLSRLLVDPFLSSQILQKNFDSLSQKTDLAKYGTAEAVRDIEVVRKHLGYNKINLYGTSYGTRVALAYLNEYPKAVHSVILKGVMPADMVIPYTFARDAQSSLNLLIQDCRSDSLCSVSFPQLEQDIETLFTKTLPINVDIYNEDLGVNETVTLDYKVVASLIRTMLMSPSSAAEIPLLITRLNKGISQPAVNWLLRLKKSQRKGMYDGMTLCVVCFEDYPFPIKPSTDKIYFLKDLWVERIRYACKYWNPTLQKAPRKPLRKSDTRILLVSGGRDPATPPMYAETLLRFFPNGQHLVIKNASHSFDGMIGCVEKIMTQFLEGKILEQIKTDCTETIRLPAFQVNEVKN
jgi:pimeloyl-ACP methyl ester carboxylesterase